jgi:hypothetical protein
MKRIFRRFRDDRFALTTLQNPPLEVRTHAELVAAAERERQNQPGAAPIPATQEQAAPGDSDAPVTLSWNAPASPEPVPAALAALDSAISEPAIPDSASEEACEVASNETRQAVQQLADLLGVSLAPQSLTESPALPEVEVNLTNHRAPKPRRKAKSKSKSRRKSHRGTRNPACASSAPPAENEDLEQEDLSGLTLAERHSRKCYICNHPDREYIEEAFLQWRSPDTIMRRWDIKAKTTIYHHAHALNLFGPRTRNLQYALGNIIENADFQGFTPKDILHAIRALAHMNEDGRWIHPTSKSEVLFSSQRLPAGQAGLPTRQASQPILIATAPELKNDANH